jgi:hypothetical protein
MSTTGEKSEDPLHRLHQLHQPTFAELYSPKLLTVFREGYGLDGFRADTISGLTVAIVALPLSMAIAIASGVTPDRGLYAAVVGGFICVAARRQSLSRSVGLQELSSCWWRWPSSATASTACCSHHDGGRDPDCGRPAAARHLHQVHSLSGHGWIHGRHRRHHLRKPAQGFVRHHAYRQRSPASSSRS